MRAEVDTTRLRRCVVRVDTSTGAMRGTGFFVAPDWVLTCAHVVEDLTVAVLVPAAGGNPLTATVAARSDPPPAGSASKLWPFPDLALLRVDQPPTGKRRVSYALLEPVQPGADRACVAWGYARRERDVDPAGSAASFEYQGVDGDGWYGLRSDVVRPGLSGSPLVCPTRRAVVAVITATRNATAPDGGWASPIDALTGRTPGVPDQLVQTAKAVLAANRAAVLADRAAWHAVLPIPGAQAVLQRSWGTFRKTKRADPADLLLADSRVVPYLFRDDDLTAAETWCHSSEPVAVGVVPGVGGAGKTRFAVELCARMSQDHGWLVGEPRDLTTDTPTLTGLGLPRLLVIDYAETYGPKALADTLDRLTHGSSDVAPVRLLLLTRDGSAATSKNLLSAIRTDATTAVKFLIDDRQESHAATATLTPGQRGTLYAAAVNAYADAWQNPRPQGAPPPFGGPDYDQPLGVLYEALDTVLTAAEPDTAGESLPDPYWGTGPAARVLAHEEKYWQAGAPEPDRDLLAQAVALASLATATDADQADTLLQLLPGLAGADAAPRRAALVRWLAGLYRGEHLLNTLRPDRLGEALITRALLSRPDGPPIVLAALLSTSPRQAARAVTVLTRATSHTTAARETATTLLAAAHPALTLRAEAAARGTPDHAGDYTLARALTAFFTSDPGRTLYDREPDNTGYQRDVSVSLNKLGDLAVAVGDSAGAHELFGRFLTIAEALTALEPENTGYQRHLAVSLDRRGNLAAAVGDRPAAREAYQRSLDILEALAAREPDNTNLQLDLSAAQIRLGDLAVGVGDGPAAHDAFRRSLAITEALAAREPESTDHQRNLSASLERLGDLAVAVGDRPAARELFERSLDIRETLAASEADNSGYQRDLTISLEKLADLAVAVGDRAGALDLRHRSLAIRESLAAAEPDNTTFQRDVATSLQGLGDLAVAVGDVPAARNAYQRSLDSAQRLAARDPENTGYQRDVAASLHRLGDLALAVGHGPAARKAYQRCLSIAEALAARDPDNTTYQRDRSIFLNKLGDVAVAVGDVPAARDAHHRSLDIARALASQQPENTGYQSDLASALERVGDLAIAVGDTPTAREAQQQSLTIREALAARDPDHTGHQRDLSISLNKLGDLARAVGDLPSARDAYRRSLTIAEALTAREPDNTNYQRDVSISLNKLGDLARAVGDLPGAREAYRRSTAIREALATHAPDNTAFQRDVGVSMSKLGDLALAVGDASAARDAYRRSLTIAEALAAREPDNTTYQHDLSISLERLGDLAIAVRDPAARDMHERSLAIREALAARAPENTAFQHDVAASLSKLGDLAAKAGHGAAARDAYLRCVTVAETVAAREPHNTGYQRDLAASLQRLGDLAAEAGDAPTAHETYQRSLDIAEALTVQEPGNTGHQRAVSVLLERLGDLARAVGDGPAARDAYQRCLIVREVLAAWEPDIAGHQRDLASALERLAVTAAGGEANGAVSLLQRAAALRRAIRQREPERLDVAEELAVSLYLLASANPTRDKELRAEVKALLEPFASVYMLNPNGVSALSWARSDEAAS